MKTTSFRDLVELRMSQVQPKLVPLPPRAVTEPHRDQFAGGKGDRLSPHQVNARELMMGIGVEAEHFGAASPGSPEWHKAREVALDHLAEHPRYYTMLQRMERSMKKKR